VSVLELDRIVKTYPAARGLLGRGRRRVTVLDHVSITVEEGETVAVVGESGAGKSTLGRIALNLIRPDSGRTVVAGQDLGALSATQLRRYRGVMQMVFQDPYASFDPMVSLEDAVCEPLLLHTSMSRAERRREALRLMERVGIRAEQARRFPNELSGGQLQRVAIARALATRPKVIVCDEPVASLDASVRAHVLNQFREIQAEDRVSYLFISHDLSLVGALADRVAVMYSGTVVEQGSTKEFFAQPMHPYSRRLLESVPEPDPTRRRLRLVDGALDAAAPVADGCVFRHRCPDAIDACRVAPTLLPTAHGGMVACHLASSVPVRAQDPRSLQQDNGPAPDLGPW